MNRVRHRFIQTHKLDLVSKSVNKTSMLLFKATQMKKTNLSRIFTSQDIQRIINKTFNHQCMPQDLVTRNQ